MLAFKPVIGMHQSILSQSLGKGLVERIQSLKEGGNIIYSYRETIGDTGVRTLNRELGGRDR